MSICQGLIEFVSRPCPRTPKSLLQRVSLPAFATSKGHIGLRYGHFSIRHVKAKEPERTTALERALVRRRTSERRVALVRRVDVHRLKSEPLKRDAPLKYYASNGYIDPKEAESSISSENGSGIIHS